MLSLNPFEVVLLLFLSGVELLIFGGLVILVYLDRNFIQQFWKRGLVFGAALFLMGLPLTIWSHGVMSRVTFDGGVDSPSPDGLVGLLMNLGLYLGLGFSAVWMVWHGLVYVVAAAEWIRLRPETGLHGSGTRTRWICSPLLIAAGLGIGVGLGCSALFAAWGIEAHELTLPAGAVAEELERVPVVVRILMALLFVSKAALLEEVMFRGALQGFLLRVLGERFFGIVFSSLVVMVLWSSLHLLNTNAPIPKLAQVALLSLVFSEMARRWGLNSTLVAHLSLNVSSVLIEFWLTSAVR